MFIAASNLPTAALLTPFVWVFVVGTLLIAVLHRFRMPSLLGFLLTGLIVGPAGLGLVQERAAIDIMAEVGIILLMFTIGLEVSLADLGRLATRVLGAGSLQIGLTTVVVAGAGIAGGLETMPAVAIGLIASASSTALVLRLLGDRGELRLPFGQFSMAILLMQDFAVVVLMLILPMLAAGTVSGVALGSALARAGAISAGIVIVARFVFPWVLTRVVDLRSREVFLLVSVVAVFGTAWVADAAGLSLALGAFLAGLVISESEFSHQMTAEVLPFRDILNGLFFASVGLLVDREVVLENLPLLGGLVVASIAAKALIVYGTARLFRIAHGPALLAAVSLAQLGEFALVLAQQAAGLELIDATQHSLLISVAVVTMVLTPIVMPLVHRAVRSEVPEEVPDLGDEPLEDHVIVIGYGVNGSNVARALTRLGVRMVIVEMNRATVLRERAAGVPIVFGDATRPALLHHLHIEHARALVSCIADAAATREIVSSAHHANPDLLIIARTRYVAEIEPLHRLGATSVVPEEFETSIELVGRVMRAYGAPEPAIHRQKRAMRGEHYRALLAAEPQESTDMEHILGDIDVARAKVGDGLAGRSLRDLDLRRASGATAIAVLRDGVSHPAPGAEFELAASDIVVVVGDAAALEAAGALLGASNQL